MKIAGIDIGGANLKFALLDSHSSSLPNEVSSGSSTTENLNFADQTSFADQTLLADEISFPFWTKHVELVATLTRIRESLGDVDGVAITMTAELADCFENKRQGVHFIVDAVESAFPNTACRFYNTAGELVEAATAKQGWALTAASNWHASAWFLFRQHQLQEGFMIDIGSTTCDIIPVQAGLPLTNGQTDLDRLRNGQLVYAGVGRTPICSLIDAVRLADCEVAIAREVFATVADAMIWTHRLPSRPDSRDSADQRPQSREACRVRLCRMLCADDCDLEDDQVFQIAEQTYSELKKRIVAGLQRVVDRHPTIVKTFCLAGSGQALARDAIQALCGDELNHRILGTTGSRNFGQAIPAIAVAARWLAKTERAR